MMAPGKQFGLNKSWELSLYELNRTPQETITDNTDIAVSPRSLHSELMCPICLDMLKKTMTTKECLHRFCSDCIITALRGNKECPTCRKKVVSKRSLRRDPNFDLLISKLYPSRDEYEAHQETVLEKLQESSSQAAFLNSITEGIKLQSQHRQQRNKKASNQTDTPNPSEPPTPTPLQNDSNSQSAFDANSQSQPSTPLPGLTSLLQPRATSPISEPVPGGSQSLTHVKPPKRQKCVQNSESEFASSSGEASGWHDTTSEAEGLSEAPLDEIELIFKPHPTEMTGNNSLINTHKENPVHYIKTTANATVDHLSKYLAMRMTLDPESGLPPNATLNFCIYISPMPGQHIALSGNQTLRQLNDKFWKVNKPLEMYYSWKKT